MSSILSKDTEHSVHQISHVHRTDNATKFMLVRILDDLDISGCEHCENLRFNLLAWFNEGANRILNRSVFHPLDLSPVSRHEPIHEPIKS